MTDDSFKSIFDSQRLNQIFLLANGKYDAFTNKHDAEPVDDPKLCSYHIQQLISEIGEVLEADKRWKNFRNDKFDKDAKADEIADCFIVLMNIAMFSGMSAEDLYNAIKNKIQIVSERIQKC
jgi:NTP pyrophosphatase (non-canonical NTP hydrolase)|nr:MAG TPA: NTP-PPase [Caudoviricetes sp.]